MGGSSTTADEAREARFAALGQTLGYLNAAELARVREAYEFADAAHAGQMRHSGDPYITHPLAVAQQVAAWKLDAPALQAALLHDVLEDCGVQRADLAARFGAQVADMVDGLTKLDKLQFSSREEGQAETFRKMLLAMASDVRVILVKLADRLHNMRTLGDMPQRKWARISMETLEIYAPIAERLGLHQVQRELQELAMRHMRPWRYAVLQRAVQRARARPRAVSQQICQRVQEALDAAHLNVRVTEREWTMPSIYRLMRDARLSFAQLSDQCPLRIIAATPLECYTVLGVLHQLYKPLLGRFKDYIAIPKSNGYQSLHTELAGPPGITLHVQIRTEAMNLVAENGITAHWMHRASQRSAAVPQGGAPVEDASWLQSMLEIQHETSDAFEFWENIRAGLTEDAVYVFTPRGRVLALPQGATPIDFAYAIHTGIGDRAVGARINGEAVPLSRPLAGGDVVEIVTAAGSRPQPEWLDFVRTGRARSHIRSQLKERAQSEIRVLGECLLLQALRAEGLPEVTEEQRAAVRDDVLRFAGKRTREELFEDIGAGRTSATVLARQMAVLLLGAGMRADAITLSRERFGQHNGLEHDAVQLDGSPDVRIHYARCCRPVPGDAVLGYLAQGEGLAVHAEHCPVVQELQRKDPERFVPVAWGEPQRAFAADITVTVNNAVGVLAGVTAALAADGVDITRIHMDDDVSQQDVLEIDFTVAVQDFAHLQDILRHLRRTPSVQRAERCAPAPEKSA